MVTSYKMNESEMGYRGSKSKFAFKRDFVKEQRVDGSYFGFYPKLRYTLMGFERNYQVKILSNKIIQRRFYSIESSTITQLIKPWFISGFTDAEGCFLIKVRKSNKNKLGWQL